jgi:hypothetical protein
MGHRGTPDQQLIIQFLNGCEDNVITESTKALEEMAVAKEVESYTATVRYWNQGRSMSVDPSLEWLKEKATKLTDSSRVYLDGHGKWQSQTMGGVRAGIIVDLLGDLKLPQEILISILGCETARDWSSEGYGLIGQSVNCFASQLHEQLKRYHSVEAIVFARVQVTGTRTWGELRGHKGVKTKEDDGPLTFKLEKSKVVYWWEDGKQRRGWANYKTKMVDVLGDG